MAKEPVTSNMQPQAAEIVVGVISDTHGLLRPEAIEALAGSHLILHAGDIGKPEMLQGLQAIAPTIAVRGNNDQGTWAAQIPASETVQVGNIFIHVLHILQDLAFAPKEQGIQVVITGHSHKPLIEKREDVLFLNPGSAGPRRFKLPVSVAQLHLSNSTIHPKIIELNI